MGPGRERRGGTLQPTPLRQTGESRTETSRAGVAKRSVGDVGGAPRQEVRNYAKRRLRWMVVGVGVGAGQL